jgi:hypothetical protein
MYHIVQLFRGGLRHFCYGGHDDTSTHWVKVLSFQSLSLSQQRASQTMNLDIEVAQISETSQRKSTY